MNETAIPQLPMKDIAETRVYYERLGFVVLHEHEAPDLFMIMARGTIQLQFYIVEAFDAARNHSGCYIVVNDLDANYAAAKASGVSGVLPVELKPWGIREFAISDPNGNLLRVGSPQLFQN